MFARMRRASSRGCFGADVRRESTHERHTSVLQAVSGAAASSDLKKVDVSSRRDWQPLPAACDKPLAQRRAVLAVEQ